MMGGSTGSTESEGRGIDGYLKGFIKKDEEYMQEYKEIIKEEQELQKKQNLREKIVIGGLIAVVAINIAVVTYRIIQASIAPPKYISPSRIEAKAIELDSTNEDLEQMLTIDGKQYTLQERNGEPTLVKYEKKDEYLNLRSYSL